MPDIDQEQLVIRTRDEAEAWTAIYTALTQQIEAALAEKNQLIVRAGAHDAEILELTNRRQRYAAGLEAWALANRKKEFGEAQQLELRQGFLKFRLGNRAVRLLKGWTEELVLAALGKTRKRKLRRCVRIVREIDRQRILRESRSDNTDKPELAAENLKSVGLEVSRTETFHIEPKLDQVPA